MLGRMTEANSILYRDRQTGTIHTETVMGDAAIKWAYLSLSGKIFAPLLFGNSFISRVLGWYFNSGFSKSKIPGTIEDLGIDSSEFEKSPESFASFNAFFTRTLKASARPFSEEPQDVIAPADGRLLVYPDVGDGTKIHVKGMDGTIDELFGESMPAFQNGSIAVFRLCPADYHRYHFPCDGQIISQKRIRGGFHSVNPLALAHREKVFCRNKRAVTIIDNDVFGQLAFIEVGAFGVAGIHDTYQGTAVKRMQEKGYFDFGGSTVVLVFQENRIAFDDDLVESSGQGIETLIRVGETIGKAL